MEFATEWEQRKYEQQKKLEKNIYTFISHNDEEALRRKRRVMFFSSVGILVACMILFFAYLFFALKWTEGDQYTTGEILEKIWGGVKWVFAALLKPKTWKILWNDLMHGEWRIRVKWYAFILQAIFCVLMTRDDIKRTKNIYEKEIVVDLNTNEITYKDMKTTAKFNSSDVEEWEFFPSIKKKRKADAFILKDHRRIYLDGFYENDPHEFLMAHKDELKLPKPKKITPREAQKYI